MNLEKALDLGTWPEKIKVHVDYYNEKDRDALSPKFASLVPSVGTSNPIEIRSVDFLTYSLFHKKNGRPGWNSYDSIKLKINKAIGFFQEELETNKESICVPSDIRKVKDQDSDVTAKMGVALSLCIANKLLGLTEADWNRITELNSSESMDYELAATEDSYYEVEAKGTFTLDQHSRNSDFSDQASKIRSQKKAQKATDEAGNRFEATRFGIISIVSQGDASIAKALLVDPPANKYLMEPSKAKLISRLRFLEDWIGFITPKSQLVSALHNRINSILNSTKFEELNGLALEKVDGKVFNYNYIIQTRFGGSPDFFASKSRIEDGPSGGVVLEIRPGVLFLVGIMGELVDLAISQNFDDIINYYRKEYGNAPGKKLICRVPQGIFNSFSRQSKEGIGAQPEGAYVTFRAIGNLVFSTEGLVFGLVTPI